MLSWPIEGAQPALPDLLQFETEAQSGHLTGNDFDVRAMHSNGSRWIAGFRETPKPLGHIFPSLWRHCLLILRARFHSVRAIRTTLKKLSAA